MGAPSETYCRQYSGKSETKKDELLVNDNRLSHLGNPCLQAARHSLPRTLQCSVIRIKRRPALGCHREFFLCGKLALIQRELPQFAFSETALQMFPQSVRNLMGDAIRKETEEDQTFGGWNPR